MKILFAIKAMDDIKGGVERIIADVSAGLIERGHKVQLLSFDRPGGQSFYPLHSKIGRICLGIGIPKNHTRLLEFLQRIGAFRRAVLEKKPDVVIAFMHSMFIPATFGLIGSGIPVIASEHIVPQHYKGKPFEYMLLILAILLARKTTVLSERIKNLYPSILRGKMFVIQNPVHIPPITADTSASHEGRKIILNVGRLTSQKDQKVLIEAFVCLKDKFLDWDIRIVGEGVLKNALQTQISAAGLDSRALLVDTTKHIEKEYLGANIFALPSSYESFGLVTAEAMAYGLPVIGFGDCAGTNEIIKDGENGLLVYGSDRVGAFAEKLEELMRSDELRKRLGENGRQTARKFKPESVIDIWEELIHHCAAR